MLISYLCLGIVSIPFKKSGCLQMPLDPMTITLSLALSTTFLLRPPEMRDTYLAFSFAPHFVLRNGWITMIQFDDRKDSLPVTSLTISTIGSSILTLFEQFTAVGVRPVCPVSTLRHHQTPLLTSKLVGVVVGSKQGVINEASLHQSLLISCTLC